MDRGQPAAAGRRQHHPGGVRLWPYKRGIADAIGDPAIERVTIVKSVRVGLTTLLTGALGSFVANEPAPILALLPTEADCRDYVVSDAEPVFEATPALRGLLAADTDGESRNRLMSRRFPGGSLEVVAASRYGTYAGTGDVSVLASARHPPPLRLVR